MFFLLVVLFFNGNVVSKGRIMMILLLKYYEIYFSPLTLDSRFLTFHARLSLAFSNHRFLCHFATEPLQVLPRTFL